MRRTSWLTMTIAEPFPVLISHVSYDKATYNGPHYAPGGRLIRFAHVVFHVEHYPNNVHVNLRIFPNLTLCLCIGFYRVALSWVMACDRCAG